MTEWLAGMKITAGRLNDGLDIETTSSGAVAGSGFSVTSFSGRRSGRMITVELFVERTGATIAESSAGSGNLTPDTVMVTLPSGWRPPEAINSVWGNGTNDGECTIGTSGDVTLRSTSGSPGVGNGTSVRVTASFLADS